MSRSAFDLRADGVTERDVGAALRVADHVFAAPGFLRRLRPFAATGQAAADHVEEGVAEKGEQQQYQKSNHDRLPVFDIEGHIGGRGGQSVEQLPAGAAEHGMDEIGDQLDQGDQNKATLMQQRMGDG